MKGNNNLHDAKRAKNDEFYTQLTDIEKEVKHYKSQFKDKVVFCNCDDPEKSNFWFFFKSKFIDYELKRLISTHYDPVNKQSYKLEIIGDHDGDGIIDDADIIKTPLQGVGDFRDEECVALLDESDIVCTNPPFSLFREFITLLIEHNKKFLVIGNNNAINYLIPLIRDNKLWLGYTSNAAMEFEVPEEYDGTERDGKKYGKVPAISWFTNLDTTKRHEELILWKKYTSKEFPEYDNYMAINVEKVNNIPMDYFGFMGVPITFMSKYNPEQFEIIGITYSTDKSPMMEFLRKNEKRHTPWLNGRELYPHIIIKNRKIDNLTDKIVKYIQDDLFYYPYLNMECINPLVESIYGDDIEDWSIVKYEDIDESDIRYAVGNFLYLMFIQECEGHEEAVEDAVNAFNWSFGRDGTLYWELKP